MNRGQVFENLDELVNNFHHKYYFCISPLRAKVVNRKRDYHTKQYHTNV